MSQKLTNNTTVLCGTLLLILTGLFVFINLPFALPLILSGIFALGVHDFIERTNKRTRLSRTWIVWIFLLSGIFFFIAPLGLAVYRLTVYISGQQNSFHPDSLLGPLQSLNAFLLRQLQHLSELIGTDLVTPTQDFAAKILQTTGTIILNFSTNLLSELPSVALAGLVFVVTLFVLVLKAEAIKQFTMHYSPLPESIMGRLIEVAKRSCAVTLFSTFVIGLLQASLIGIGSLIFGEGDFWLVVTITFFLSFIPVIGAAPVGYFLAILAFVGDRTGAGIGLAIVATAAGSIDNILKPFMVGGDNHTSAIIAFTSVVGAIIMIGIPGLLLGPVIMNLFSGITPILMQEMQSAKKQGHL